MVSGLRLFRMEKNKPKLIQRIDDGELLKLNEDKETYSFVKSEMAEPFRYTYNVLMKSYKGKFRDFKDRRVVCIGSFT